MGGSCNNRVVAAAQQQAGESVAARKTAAQITAITKNGPSLASPSRTNSASCLTVSALPPGTPIPAASATQSMQGLDREVSATDGGGGGGGDEGLLAGSGCVAGGPPGAGLGAGGMP